MAENEAEAELASFDMRKKKRSTDKKGKKAVKGKKDKNVAEVNNPEASATTTPSSNSGSTELAEKPAVEVEEEEEEVFEEVISDYNYDELLERVFDHLQSDNPDLLTAKRNKQVFTIPEVFRSPKKTIWVNFQNTCKNMHRSPEHFITFVLSELGTTGQLDGNKRLVVNGRFNPRQLENVEKNYIEEYIICKTCKAFDTILKKENRLFFIVCNMCSSQRTVAAVKTGYVAQVGRRKK